MPQIHGKVSFYNYLTTFYALCRLLIMINIALQTINYDKYSVTMLEYKTGCYG